MKQIRATVLLVGDELLDGFVQDSNLAVLARLLRARGIALERAAVLPDDVDVIAAELRHALAAPRPSLVITTGGTGGTWDDVTYEAIARAAGVPLRVDPQLESSVRRLLDWTAGAGHDVDDDAVTAMMRIATVPEGSTVHFVDAWLVCLQLDLDGGVLSDSGSTLLVLPGPLGHVRRLAEGVIASTILGPLTGTLAVAEVQHGYPETLVVGELGRIGRRRQVKWAPTPATRCSSGSAGSRTRSKPPQQNCAPTSTHSTSSPAPSASVRPGTARRCRHPIRRRLPSRSASPGPGLCRSRRRRAALRCDADSKPRYGTCPVGCARGRGAIRYRRACGHSGRGCRSRPKLRRPAARVRRRRGRRV